MRNTISELHMETRVISQNTSSTKFLYIEWDKGMGKKRLYGQLSENFWCVLLKRNILEPKWYLKY